MQFTYTITIDDDYTPDGDYDLAEEQRQINNHEIAPYGVIVRAVGPVDSEESLWGCVVPLADTGTFDYLDKIDDAHLREVARGLADVIKDRYLDELTAKRDEINAMIQQMGGV